MSEKKDKTWHIRAAKEIAAALVLALESAQALEGGVDSCLMVSLEGAWEVLRMIKGHDSLKPKEPRE